MRILFFVFMFSSVAAHAAEPADLLARLDAYNQSLSAADRHAKYCKMSASPLAFLRGSNHLFWEDFSQDPRLAEFSSPATQTWLQGDLHVYNFGTLSTAGDEVVYALNDFDDSFIADYQYDLWRMSVSLVLLGRHAKLEKPGDLVEVFAAKYLDTLAAGEIPPPLAAKDAPKRLRKFIEKQAEYPREKFLKKWLTKKWRFDIDSAKLAALDADTAETLEKAINGYRETLSAPLRDDADYFQVKSMARRIGAGTGSLGTPRYYVLIEGPSKDADDDRILDVKQQRTVSAYPWLKTKQQTEYRRLFPDQGQRYVEAYRALTGAPDPLLGTLELDGAVHSVRERAPCNDGFPAEEVDKRKHLKKLAAAWGEILAASHARAAKAGRFVKSVNDLIQTRRFAFIGQVQDIARAYAQVMETGWKQLSARNKCE